MKHYHRLHLQGFTLAEVLITLGIIGIVASMTIPTLITNYQERVLITKNKQTFSLILQALNRAKADSPNFSFDGYVFNTNNTSQESSQLFSQYFKVTSKNVPSYTRKYMKPTPNPTSADNYDSGVRFPANNFQLSNGALIGIVQYQQCERYDQCFISDGNGGVVRDENGHTITQDCKVNKCAMLQVDVNGEKEPNQLGKDCFNLDILSDTYKTWATSYYGDIEYIIKNGKFSPNIVDYELGGLK